jgi:hypothetical protein
MLTEQGLYELASRLDILIRADADAPTLLRLVNAAVESEMRNLGVHLSHCNFGENAGGCKYGDPDCPALAGWAWFGRALDRERKED